MPEIIEPACTTLQSEPDNIEIIRDQIAALLAVDFAHQAELAAEAGAEAAPRGRAGYPSRLRYC